MAVRPLPRTPDDITASWLTDVLHDSVALGPDNTVATFDRTPVGEGVGMLSEIEFLHLTYSDDTAGAPDSVVVKFPTRNETNRQVAQHFNVYAREVRYFAELHAENAASGPDIHLSAIEGETDFVIVMENLSDYVLGDQVVGADLRETQLSIDELAKLHASFWGEIDGDEYDWLPLSAGSTNAANMHEGAKVGWDTTVEIFGDHIPQWMRDAKDRYLAAVPAMQQRLDASPRTLVHGDFRMDNLFFGRNETQYPMTMVDWQGPLRGRGIHDVAYLLGQSTQIDVRRSNERDLIQRYLSGLAQFGIEGIELDDAWEEYRNAVLYIWVYAAVIAGTLDATNERGNAWMAEMIKRNIAAIEDLDCLDLL